MPAQVGEFRRSANNPFFLTFLRVRFIRARDQRTAADTGVTGLSRALKCRRKGAS